MKNSYDKSLQVVKSGIKIAAIIVAFIFPNMLKGNVSIHEKFDKFCSADTAIKNINELLKKNSKHIRHIKIKSSDTTTIYYYNKTSKAVVAIVIQIFNPCCGSFTRYHFHEGVLVKVLYLRRSNKNQKPKPGGVYYFSANNLLYFEEYSIPNQRPENFLNEAVILKEKSKGFISKTSLRSKLYRKASY
jgi:hypothetical protein